MLLFYYARPLTFHCRWDGQTPAKYYDVIYCAVCDNWDSLCIKIANTGIYKQRFDHIPNIISYQSKNKPTQTMTYIYGEYEFNQEINSFKDNQKLVCDHFSTKWKGSNIGKMLFGLPKDQCTFKWTSKALNTDANLLELFQIYMDTEQLDSDGIEVEFGEDACMDECFFIEWLRDEDDQRLGLSIKDENQWTAIWMYLSTMARR